MKFEEWWKKQTENFDPDEIGLMQLARVTWYAAQEIEREACAKLCESASDSFAVQWDENGDHEAHAASKAAQSCADSIRIRQGV